MKFNYRIVAQKKENSYYIEHNAFFQFMFYKKDQVVVFKEKLYQTKKFSMRQIQLKKITL